MCLPCSVPSPPPFYGQALRKVSEEGRGVVVYIKGHEGRGIGLSAKVSREKTMKSAGHEQLIERSVSSFIFFPLSLAPCYPNL